MQALLVVCGRRVRVQAQDTTGPAPHHGAAGLENDRGRQRFASSPEVRQAGA
jgi:hypothetical protein